MRYLILLFIMFCSPIPNANAAIIYVDKTIADCTTTQYNPTTRLCSGGSADSYDNIQQAIDVMSTGDTILIRGGTYHETNGNPSEMINIPNSLNGSSWSETACDGPCYNTIASYPGEWAILDGEFSAPLGVVLGNYGNQSSGSTSYWKFERLGFTRGTSPGDAGNGGAGLLLAEGPIKIRYCDFYNNWDDQELNNPTGLATFRLQNSIIEYNRFYHNGCNTGDNCSALEIYSDYDWEAWKANWGNFTIDYATQNNEIRYNYFEDGHYGIKDKGVQMLTQSPPGADTTWEEYGDKIHHNIFVGYSMASVMINQDFKQVYKNIFDGAGIDNGEWDSSTRNFLTIYNNTILGGGGYRGWTKQAWPYQPVEDHYNNIVASTTIGIDPVLYPTVIMIGGANSADANVGQFSMSSQYYYDFSSPSLTLRLCSSYSGSYSFCGDFTVAEFDTEYGFTNYQKASSEGSDNLFEGSTGEDQYITRDAHSTGTTTIAVGSGSTTPHPYLSEVTIPSYLGATNPDDHAWVAGILDDLNAASFTIAEAGSTPTWIEGGAQAQSGQWGSCTGSFK